MQDVWKIEVKLEHTFKATQKMVIEVKDDGEMTKQEAADLAEKQAEDTCKPETWNAYLDDTEVCDAVILQEPKRFPIPYECPVTEKMFKEGE